MLPPSHSVTSNPALPIELVALPVALTAVVATVKFKAQEAVGERGAIERGEKDLRLSTLVKLARVFRVGIRELFG